MCVCDVENVITTGVQIPNMLYIHITRVPGKFNVAGLSWGGRPLKSHTLWRGGGGLQSP